MTIETEKLDSHWLKAVALQLLVFTSSEMEFGCFKISWREARVDLPLFIYLWAPQLILEIITAHDGEMIP